MCVVVGRGFTGRTQARGKKTLALPLSQVTYSGELGRGVQYCRFFKNMLPEVPVAASQAAGLFFAEEDFELELLKDGKCPFSRATADDVKDYGPL